MVFAALTTVWSLSTGMAGSPDEPSHVIKAVAVADGQLTTSVTPQPGGIDASFPVTRVRAPSVYAQLVRLSWCWATVPSTPAADCEPLRDEDTQVGAVGTYVGTYPPTYYLAVGWPSRLLDATEAVYAMRIVSALIAASLLAEATYLLTRRGRAAGAVAGLALAVPPSVLFLGGTVNPGGLEAAASICLWAAILGLADAVGPRGAIDRRTLRRPLASALVAALLLVGTRPLGPAFVIVIVCVALAGSCPPSALRVLAHDRWVRRTAAAVVLAGSVWLVVGVANHTFTSFVTWEGLSERGPVEAASDALGSSWEFLSWAVGSLGWLSSAPSTLSVLVWLGGIGSLLVIALVGSRSRGRLALGLLAMGCLLLPVVSTVSSPGAVWQGRYVLPLLVGIPLLAGWTIDHSSRWTPRAVRRWGLAVVVSCAVAYVAAHQRLMDRTVVGLPTSWFSNLSAGEWTGPLTPQLLLVWAVVASAAYLAVLGTLVSAGPDLRTGSGAAGVG